MRRHAKNGPTAADVPVIPDALDVALDHHQAGRFVAADAAYHRLAGSQPDDADVWHLWGVLAAQTGQYAAAVRRIRRALELRPRQAVFLGNLGNAFLQLGQPDQAIVCYREAIDLQPDDMEIRRRLNSTCERQLELGIEQQKTGRLADARASYRDVLRGQPESADAWHLSGLIEADLGHHQTAIAHIGRAIALAPDTATFHKSLGSVHQRLQDSEKAIECYRQAIALHPDYPEAFTSLIVLLKDIGRYGDAEAACHQAIALRPDYPEAFRNLGNLLRKTHRDDDAEVAYRRAIALRPDYPDALNNLGVLLQASGRDAEAEVAYRQAIALGGDCAEAQYNLGILLTKAGRKDEAETAYRQAIALRADYPEALNNLGNLLRKAHRYDDAEATYRQAIALRPIYPEAHNNFGILLKEVGRRDEAESAYRQAITLRPDYPEAFNNLGILLTESGRHDAAEAAYREAIALRPDYPDALYNLGNLLTQSGCHNDAEAAYRQAIALRRDYPDALYNLGILLTETNRHDEAEVAYRQAIALRPAHPGALNNLGSLLYRRQQLSEALACVEKLLAVAPDHSYAPGAVANCLARMADWAGEEATRQRLVEGVREKKHVVTPFILMSFCDDPLAQRQCAELFVAREHPVEDMHGTSIGQYSHDRIRLAYISPDFGDHPVAYLIADLIERHDRQRFEVYGVAVGQERRGLWHERLRRGFDHFLDLRGTSDEAAATRLGRLEIDIAVDLAGYTTDSRTGIFAARAAPVQVNYLGFPGTMGAPFIDYILADRLVIPDTHEPFYAEKVVRLPDTFQCSPPRPVANATPARREAGLPENGFVFCCFNNTRKINPKLFDIWMRLLKQVEGSVLWLSKANQQAAGNLRRETQGRGVDPDRLVFASPVAGLDEHLARQRLADLFLDTLPYNAHTTAGDALWVGLPVLTCLGNAFAGRVAASLLHAVGLPELVTGNLADYEDLALRLATHPGELAAIRLKLERNRLSSPLFDVDRFRRHIEAAYQRMWEIRQGGEAPMAFSIAPIENGASPAVSPLAAPHREAPPAKSEAPASEPGAPKEGPPWQMVLHVGCGPARQDSLPSIFRTPQWRELRLDIDPGCQPDLVGSITSMTAVESGSCTAVFSSHNLEHLQPHEVQVALAEFVRVLTPDGFALVTVPDVQQVAALITEDRLEDAAYVSPAGPIAPLDMLYGHRPSLARGNLFMAHRTGFTATTLSRALLQAGFVQVGVKRDGRYGLWAIAYRQLQDDERLAVMEKAVFAS